MLVLGVYWLQRLFGEYQVGHFFTDATMRCYVWLVWLKVGNFGYGAIWPFLLGNVVGTTSGEQARAVDVGSLVELVILVLIVHVLKEAQQVHEENQAFV
jgi:hypothetical protein